jgi:carbon-monoxide dehydrogenase large subunit
MDYKALRAEQAELREQGIYRGIGLAAMIEVTNPSPAFYGVGGARISAQDGATVRLDPTGMVNVLVSVDRAGPGHRSASSRRSPPSAVGVDMDRVRVITGDTAVTPYGGGTWASRGAGIGGEAVLQAGQGAAREHPGRRRGHPAARARPRWTCRASAIVDKLTGAGADARWPRWAASPTSAPTRCR